MNPVSRYDQFMRGERTVLVYLLDYKWKSVFIPIPVRHSSRYLCYGSRQRERCVREYTQCHQRGETKLFHSTSEEVKIRKRIQNVTKCNGQYMFETYITLISANLDFSNFLIKCLQTNSKMKFISINVLELIICIDLVTLMK